METLHLEAVVFPLDSRPHPWMNQGANANRICRRAGLDTITQSYDKDSGLLSAEIRRPLVSRASLYRACLGLRS